MTPITCYGGVAEIGGNKILVEDRDARIWLDMGQSFGFGSEYFVEFLQHRARFGLRDYFALDLMPKLAGLYSQDWLDGAGVSFESPRFSSLFLSHIYFYYNKHPPYLHPLK